VTANMIKVRQRPAVKSGSTWNRSMPYGPFIALALDLGQRKRAWTARHHHNRFILLSSICRTVATLMTLLLRSPRAAHTLARS